MACAIIGVRSMDPRAYDTDIQSLLPQTAIEPVIRAAIADASAIAAGRVAIVVEGADETRAAEGAADLERALTDAKLLRSDRADGEAVGRWIYANRNALICARDPAAFDGPATARKGMALLYSPATPVTGEFLSHDPFLLTLQLSQCLAPQGALRTNGGAFVSGALQGSAFRIDVEDGIEAALKDWRARWPDLTLARAGAVFYAEAAARSAKAEFSLIAGVSTIAILALLAFYFLRAEAIVGTLAVTAAGMAGSLAVALLVFPSVHVLVFVFGSALIGVTSDYALHYLATGPQTGWADRKTRVALVFRPLLVCALSTGLGFASLALFGVPVFQQVAVFSIAGLATAWWFTISLLPFMDLRARDPEKLSAWWRRMEAPLLKLHWTRTSAAIGIAGALLVGGIGVARFGVLDDVRQFQSRPHGLAQEEEKVRAALGFSPSSSFILSYGASGDEAREREEAMLSRLPEEDFARVLAVSRFDPSLARRTANEDALRTQLYAPLLAGQIDGLGLAAPDPFAGGAPAEKPSLIAQLEGATGGVHYLTAPIVGAAPAAEAVHGEGAALIDPAQRYSRAFANYRVLGAWAIVGAFGACAALVFGLYRKLSALLVLAAPAAGCVLALLVPAALGQPISFFTIAALFVVMGAGIDHSVFQFEAKESGGQPKELVVFLAAVTTILSMGLLGFSATYPVRSFGLAVAVGVTVAYLFSFSPAVARRGGGDGET